MGARACSHLNLLVLDPISQVLSRWMVMLRGLPHKCISLDFLLWPPSIQRNRGLRVDLDPELETNLVPDNQSTYSTQCGCSSHLEFDFKARPPADCSVVGRLTQCILSGHSGNTPPAEGHHGVGPDFSECRLLPGLPAGLSVSWAHLHRLEAQCPQD